MYHRNPRLAGPWGAWGARHAGPVVAVMTVHKLSAGKGYTYLTRQVASGDECRRGLPLADYYAARGNPPGVWLGSGAAVLGVAGGVVSEAQMCSLFGLGCHPDRDAMLAAGAPMAATKLGASYPSYADLAPYEQRLADAVAAFAERNGRPPSATEHNQLAAKEARRGRRAVAGFDLVFTPVKSVSLLWALGGPEVRAEVEAAHHEAVASTIGWLEEHAAFTRTGQGGAAQVDTTGLVCAAFDHRESRSGDPDLHTHVAVANKVQGLDGKWRSLDARNLHALGVAASERYNTRLEDGVARRLGVQFEERPGGAAGKRPVREVAGVPVELLRHFSRRRALIEDRYADLRHQYRTTHGREPDRATQLQLAQQATLETREGKGPGRTLAEQIADWTAQATTVLGKGGLARMLASALHRPVPVTLLAAQQQAELAARVVRTVSSERSTWTRWNLVAETERQLRGLRFATAADRDRATAAVVVEATSPRLSIRIAEPELVTEPAALTRASDGQSVFVPHGSERYTSSEILISEDALIGAGRTLDGPCVDPLVVEAAVAVHESTTGLGLDAGQRSLVAALASSPARLVVGIGPAGAGKTTAMRAFAAAWHANGGRVVLLASSSKAAHVLGSELGERAENLHKFLHENHRPAGPTDPWFRLGAGDVVVVDEAGMAGTLHLAELLRLTTAVGAGLRLVGDPAQLAAVDAGGALRLLEREAGATYLTDLHRFRDPAEGTATLALRTGDPSALDFYESHDRIRAGSADAMLEAAYAGWSADVRRGQTSVLIAATTGDVAALNARARTERVLAGTVESSGLELHDGTLAGVGDWVVTRANARTLTCRRGRDWVRNGDAWRVVRRHDDGSLTLRHLTHSGKVRLPADYVADSVELAYAATAHRAQGITTDTAHALVTPEMTREALYVASSRGRDHTTWYTATETALDVDGHAEDHAPHTVREVLTGVLARTGSEDSATDTIRQTLVEASSLPTLVARYQHARTLAAADALREAATVLPASERGRILHDRSAPYLARVLADAASRGANPSSVLKRAYEFADMSAVRSPATVLATRISDYAPTLGVPQEPPADRPLPWLPGPHVGHSGWDPYLTTRAELIADRASTLGTLASAYREQYRIGHQHGLGDPPTPDSNRRRAYDAALAEHLAHQRLDSGAQAGQRRTAATPNPHRPTTPTRRAPGPAQRLGP